MENISINKHSSIRIQGSKVLYFDPFGIENISNDADVIFITHDHFEPESIYKIQNESTILIAPETMKKKVIIESGIVESNCIFYQPGTVHELGKLWIETVPAYNRIKPFHPKVKKWQGYVVQMDGVRYYVAGDTDVNEDIKKVKCDVALIPIGGTYTMDKKQAADFILNMKPKYAIPTHYGEIAGNNSDGKDFMDYIDIVDNNINVVLKI